jgi:AcrR family transcriptional regulator
MSPRRAAVPEIRERLFNAAQDLLLRDGAQSVTGRAITREAGCASGLLGNHFGSFDAFLVQFALDRFRRHVAALEALPSRAGTGTVAANLADATAALFTPEMIALARLMLSRPGLIGRAVREAAGARAGHRVLEETFAAYLSAEQRLGRLADGTDTDAIAVVLVALVHQMLLMPPAGSRDPRRLLDRAVTALAHGITSPAARA